ncbi:MAG TPA: hypothetical protein VFX96_09070, partial [Pyrinomonadaceae bacterium]|nr:hypothetical protein [Pyrinomonadaceae bacterium]
MHVCETTRVKLVDLLFEELGARESLRLRAELEVCSPCREQHDALAQTLKVMDVAAEASAPGEEFWHGYEERLRRRMAQVIRTEDLAGDGAHIWTLARADYRLTMLEDEGLASRLAAELRSAAERSRLTWPEFRRDPFGFTGRLFAAYASLGWRFVSQRNVALASASSLAVMLSVVFGVMALERLR